MFDFGGAQPREQNAAMMRMSVGRNARDALSRRRVNGVETSRAGRCEADVIGLFRHVFEYASTIRGLEFDSVLDRTERIGRGSDGPIRRGHADHKNDESAEGEPVRR